MKLETSLKISSLNSDHLRAVSEIELSVMHNPWSFSSFNNSFKNEDIMAMVVEIDGKIIGYVWGRRVVDEVELYKIAVASDYQSKGIGSFLLGEFGKKCRDENIVAIHLEVDSSNYQAISVYKKHGYVDLGIRKDYYGKGKDAQLMSFEFRL